MNEKLVINANLLRKEPGFGTRVCVVEKAEAVTHDKFERLKRHPMQDNDLIAENIDLMFCDINNEYHCLLIYDEDQGDGLLIESEAHLMHVMLSIFQMQNCFTKIICKRICGK